MYVMHALVCNQSLIGVPAVLFSPTPMPSLPHLDSPPYTNLSSYVEALLTLTRALTPAPGHPIHFCFDCGALLLATSPAFPLAYLC